MLREPVDAVITWVDGYDKTHAEKLARYLEQMGTSSPEAAAPTRYNQCGEIRYCVKSILRFAPWIRTIYIVTDAQTPPIMKQLAGLPQGEKIKLIDHRDIFYGFEACLPTFNSLTIECMLWRIPGLSDHFLYLNDDCSIIRPVSYDDFFRGNQVVLYGQWRTRSERKWGHYVKKFIAYLSATTSCSPSRDLFRAVCENSAELAGYHKQFFQFPHAPFPLRKKAFEDYFLKHPEALSQNIRYRFRSYRQFAPISLIHHLEIQQKNVVFDPSLEAIMVNGACHSLSKIKHRLARADRKKNVAFICMQSIDEAPVAIQTMLLEWLHQKIE